MTIFKYEVGYYSSYYNDTKHEKGILCAESYADAVRKLNDPDIGYGDLDYVRIENLGEEIITGSDLEIYMK